MKKNFVIPVLLSAFVLLLSFNGDNKGINELPKSERGKYAFIAAGKVFFQHDSSELGCFYISKTEIDNEDYREFINDLKKSRNEQELAIAIVDSEKWKSKLTYNEPYTRYYHSYSAYDRYPVVNISYEGAMLYCKWLTNKLNKNYSRNFSFEVRLPSRTEWMRAAQLDKRNFVYSWGGPFLRNNRGNSLCNYRQVGDESIHEDLLDPKKSVVYSNNMYASADLLAPVESYYPNQAGLYNMNGNAAEMVSEKGTAVGGSWSSTGYDVRNESTMNYSEASPFVGFRPVLIVKSNSNTQPGL